MYTQETYYFAQREPYEWQLYCNNDLEEQYKELERISKIASRASCNWSTNSTISRNLEISCGGLEGLVKNEDNCRILGGKI